MNLFDNPYIDLLADGLLISVGINFLFFLVAAFRRTDRVTDLAYSLSFVVVAGYVLVLHREGGFYTMFPAAAIILWAFRLGGYLFYRIIRIGRDRRFDGMRQALPRFAAFWGLQAVTVWLVSAPLLLATPADRGGPLFFSGLVLWVIGLSVESVADLQKFRFKSREENRSRWIENGLWAHSRHPNYFGEALLWWGIFLMLLPALSGWRYLAVLGPLFLTLLLRYVSGVPLLEKKAMERFGNDPAYREYLTRTPAMFFRLCRK